MFYVFGHQNCLMVVMAVVPVVIIEVGTESILHGLSRLDTLATVTETVASTSNLLRLHHIPSPVLPTASALGGRCRLGGNEGDEGGSDDGNN